MKNGLLKKLVSLTLSAVMMSSFAAVSTYAETEETIKWGYIEDFEDYEAGDFSETTYVEYSSAVVENEGNKCLPYGTTITVNKFPKEKVIVSMDITTTGFFWVRLMHGNDNQQMGDWIQKDEAGTHTIVFDYTPTEAESSQTYFTIIHAGEITSIDNIKIYLDGENLKPAPAFELDLDDYTQGEIVYTSDVVTLQNNKVLNNGTYNYLPGHSIIINRYPEKKLIIDLELEGNDYTQLYAKGESSQIQLENTGFGSSGYVKYHFVVKPDSSKSYLQLVLPETRHIRSLKIWNDDEEAVVENWENYSEYTYMTDFEGDAVDTTPTDKYISFGDRTVVTNNGNNEIEGSAISLTKIPEKNFIVSCDIRLMSSASAEQLQLWINGASGDNTIVAHHYDSYISDENEHSLMIIGDMKRQTVNVYIDGIFTNNVQKNENVSDWKAKVDSKSITSIGVHLHGLFVDNLKIDIDKEMLYTGCMISDSNGAKLNTLISGTTVRGAVYGVSNLRKDNPAQMIIALYEIKEDGTPYLVNCDITDLNAKYGGIVYYGDEFSVGSLDADKMYCVKQFIWDNVDDMNPLTLVSEIYTATNN